MLGNDREAVTTDGPGIGYSGGIVNASGSHLTLNNRTNWQTHDWRGAAVIITAGRGIGQWRTLTKWGPAEIETDEPFQPQPDTSSTIEVTPLQFHYTFVRNHFFDAGVSIEVYGIGINHIVAENDSTRAGGFNAISLDYSGIQPILNVQFLQNEILPGLNFNIGDTGAAYASPSSFLVQAVKGGFITGVVIRNNLLAPGALIRVIASDSSRITGGS